MARTTIAQLEQTIERIATDNAALRKQLSLLQHKIDTLTAPRQPALSQQPTFKEALLALHRQHPTARAFTSVQVMAQMAH